MILLVILLVSLQVSEYQESKNSELNFYLPFSRFWELLVGSLLAYREINFRDHYRKLLRNAMSCLGVGILVGSFWLFDSSTPHPGYYSVVPILGVSLIVCFASDKDIVGKILGWQPFVWLGLISYSAYLWHFPVFAFSRIGDRELSNFDKIGLIALTFVLSLLSYRLVERPFRDRHFISARKFWILLFLSMSLLLGIGFLVNVNEGYAGRFSKVLGLENYELDNERLRNQSRSLIKARDRNEPDFKAVSNRILLVGNSHAMDLFNALSSNSEISPDFDYLRSRVVLEINCFDESIESYEDIQNLFYASSRYRQATTIIVSTRYRKSGACNNLGPSIEESPDLNGLGYLISRAKSDGKSVLVLGNTAEFLSIDRSLIADYVYKKYRGNFELNSRALFRKIERETERLLFLNLDKSKVKLNQQIKMIVEQNKGLYFDKTAVICDFENRRCSAFNDDGYKVFYDYGHWTLEGAKLFGERLLKNREFVGLLHQ